ncbi:hypothetical protein Kisp01_41000 [Kineosporia sp. NBRC 101677]|nr:hypothetical protein Kisp01_41000 [Kineosporia sp. NBRC 101677]
MIAVTYGHHAHPVLARAAHRLVRSVRRDYLAYAVFAVDDGQCATVDNDFRPGDRVHDSRAQAFYVPAEPQQPVRGMPPQIRGDQTVGDETGVLCWNPQRTEDAGGHLDQMVRFQGSGEIGSAHRTAA